MYNPDLSRMSQRLKSLDRIHRPLALSLGLLTGLAVGILFAQQSPWMAIPAFAVLLALSAWIAVSGEPVAVVEAQEDPLWADIPGGRFWMGSPWYQFGRYSDEGPRHKVTVSPFRCMRIPVTRQLYRTIMANNSSLQNKQADIRPVTEVTWFGAVEFCNVWSKKDGLEPCYRIDGNSVDWNSTADGYRLLTEAEWEYACRAGSQGKWCFGSKKKRLLEYAWFERNANDRSHSVGRKKPNSFGLFDMHGNIWEWCWDWYGTYSKKKQIDPKGPSKGGSRVLRGGSFFVSARDLRSAFRYGVEPEDAGRNDGFRCARGPRREP